MKRTPVTVDFFVMAEICEPFIRGVNGICTLKELEAIEKEFIDIHQDIDWHLDGNYKIECSWYPGQFDELGRCELAPGWEFVLIKFDAAPTEDES